MTEDDRDPDLNPEEGEPHGSTLPPGSPTAGEAALEKEGVEWEGEKAGKGGDHPTHGAGEHDDPNN